MTTYQRSLFDFVLDYGVFVTLLRGETRVTREKVLLRTVGQSFACAQGRNQTHVALMRWQNVCHRTSGKLI